MEVPVIGQEEKEVPVLTGAKLRRFPYNSRGKLVVPGSTQLTEEVLVVPGTKMTGG